MTSARSRWKRAATGLMLASCAWIMVSANQATWLPSTYGFESGLDPSRRSIDPGPISEGSGDCDPPGDGDGDGRVGPPDYRLMFECLTDPVGPVDPPAYDPGCVCFDMDQDGDVDLRDFAAFQTAFERVAPVSVELVVRATSGEDDRQADLPVGDFEFPAGESLMVEVWAQTQRIDGLASVYVDVWFDPASLTATGIMHTDLFDLFPMGDIDNEAGSVRMVGGSHLGVRGCADRVGGAPGWARVAVIEMRADAPGATTVSSADTDSPLTISICGSFERPAAEYGDRELTIVEP